MKPNHLSELIEESIRLEQNIAALYRIFSAIPEDHDFWWQLSLEEKSHATLIRSARDSFVKRGKFPVNLLADSIDELLASNLKVEGYIQRFTPNPPDRHEACRIAIELENESGEIHFTQFMEKKADSVLEKVFQQLNRDDKAHEKRIRTHCKSIGAGL